MSADSLLTGRVAGIAACLPRTGAAPWRPCAGVPCPPTSSHDDPVPQPHSLLPGDLREPGSRFVSELASGSAEHCEVPSQRVAALAVSFQLVSAIVAWRQRPGHERLAGRGRSANSVLQLAQQAGYPAQADNLLHEEPQVPQGRRLPA